MPKGWTSQQQKIFLDRYALKSRSGAPLETCPEEMWLRVANALAGDPDQMERFLRCLSDFRFIPSGRVLAGAGGSAREATFYNCFVIGLGEGEKKGRDSRQGIMGTMTRMIEITARGGGVGINWSAVRPEGSYISGVQGWSSGANCWMTAADGLANQIRQGGSRTAALMFLLEDWHPDVMNFVSGGKRFARANYSIGISSAFMQAVEDDGIWQTFFPNTQNPQYDATWDGDIDRWMRLHGQGDVIAGPTFPARRLWRMIAESAWATGNPGVVFIDRARRWSNTRGIDRVVGVNPCGEQPLPESGSCNLGSINLMEHVLPGGRGMDWDKLAQTVILSVELLDRVIDMSVSIDDRITEHQRDVRRIGLGTMGLADLLIHLGVRYGSEESLSLIQELYGFIRDRAYLASAELARRLGPAPAYCEEILSSRFLSSLPPSVRNAIRVCGGLRNLGILTQAPTGTISVLAGVSSGIEPIFSAEYVRRDATGESVVKHPAFTGDLGPEHVTARGIPVEEHLAVQAEVQRFVDSAVSKTINLPASASVEDIERAFLRAFELGCKGTTIYRDGSLEGVLIATDPAPSCDTNGGCKTCKLE